MQKCRDTVVEIPVEFDVLTVAIHPGNTWGRIMTVAQLKKIWEPAAEGEVMQWNQINSYGFHQIRRRHQLSAGCGE